MKVFQVLSKRGCSVIGAKNIRKGGEISIIAPNLISFLSAAPPPIVIFQRLRWSIKCTASFSFSKYSHPFCVSLSCLGLNSPSLIISVMYFTYLNFLLILLPSIYSATTWAERLTQNQTCANACTAAEACDHQCVPGAVNDLIAANDSLAAIDTYTSCLCQSGCLCNAVICLQCCEVAGNNDFELQSCDLTMPPASDVLTFCSTVSAAPVPPSLSLHARNNNDNDWSNTRITLPLFEVLHALLEVLLTKDGAKGKRTARRGLFRLRRWRKRQSDLNLCARLTVSLERGEIYIRSLTAHKRHHRRVVSNRRASRDDILIFSWNRSDR